MFNLAAIALDWSYVIPIFCKLVHGQFEPGPWHLGKASFFVNIWACIWTMFVTIIFLMPTVRPVTALNVSCLANVVRRQTTCSSNKLFVMPCAETRLMRSTDELCDRLLGPHFCPRVFILGHIRKEVLLWSRCRSKYRRECISGSWGERKRRAQVGSLIGRLDRPREQATSDQEQELMVE